MEEKEVKKEERPKAPQERGGNSKIEAFIFVILVGFTFFLVLWAGYYIMRRIALFDDTVNFIIVLAITFVIYDSFRNFLRSQFLGR